MKEKKFYITFCLPLFLFLGVFQTYAQEKLMAWRLKDLTGAKAYFLTTVPDDKVTLFPLDSTLYQAFHKSDFLLLPVNPDSIRLQSQKLVLQYGTFSKGQTLKSHVNKRLYRGLLKSFEESGIPTSSTEQLKPWVLAAMAPSTKSGVIKEQDSLMMYFFKRAKKVHKRIAALETPREQVQLYAGLPEETMLPFLKEIVTPQKVEEVSEKMPPKDSLLLFSQAPLEDQYPTLYRELITKRNLGWTHEIKRILGNYQIPFVILPKEYLLGEKGILNALKNNGYSIDELRSSGNSTAYNFSIPEPKKDLH